MPYQNLPQNDYSGVHQGLAILAQGANRLGEGVGRAVEKYRDEKKRLNQAAGIADGAWKFLGDKAPIDYETFKAKPAQERVNLFQGLMEAQGYEKGATDMAAAARQIDRLKQQQELELNNDAVKLSQDRALTGFAQNLSRNTLERYYEGTDDLSPLAASAAQAMFNNPGAVAHPEFDSMMRSFTGTAGGQEIKPRMMEGPGGSKVLYNPHTGAMHVLDEQQGETFNARYPAGPDGKPDYSKPFYPTSKGGVQPFPQAKSNDDSGQHAKHVVELHSILSGIDNKIREWKAEEQQSKRSKNIPAPDPALLKEYQADRDDIRLELKSLKAGKGAPSTVPHGALDANDARRQAREAISAGADRKHVLERLRELGVDAGGL